MRRRRGGQLSNQDHALFGSTGWLFADLMVALAMAFLVANTVGQPPTTTTTTSTTVAPTTTVVPTTTTRPPELDLEPVVLHLRVDHQGLLRHDHRAIATVQNQVKGKQALKGRRAGLVLTFGGAGGTSTDQARRVAEQVDRLALKGLGRKGFVFQGTVYREFHDLNKPPNAVLLNIYLFKRQPGG